MKTKRERSEAPRRAPRAAKVLIWALALLVLLGGTALADTAQQLQVDPAAVTAVGADGDMTVLAAEVETTSEQTDQQADEAREALVRLRGTGFEQDGARYYLPAWRWRANITDLHSSFGIQDRLMIVGPIATAFATFAFSMMSVMWAIMLFLLQHGLTTDLLRGSGGSLNVGFTEVSNIVQGTGLMALFAAVAMFAIATALLKARVKQAVGFALAVALPVAALTGLTSMAAQQNTDTVNGAMIADGEPPAMSPGWFAIRGLEATDNLAYQAASGFSIADSFAANIDGASTVAAPSCQAYMDELHQRASALYDGGLTAEQAALLRRLDGETDLNEFTEARAMSEFHSQAIASTLWESTVYRSWANANFGSGSGQAERVGCRYLESSNRTGAPEQAAITIAAAANGHEPALTEAQCSELFKLEEGASCDGEFFANEAGNDGSTLGQLAGTMLGGVTMAATAGLWTPELGVEGETSHLTIYGPFLTGEYVREDAALPVAMSNWAACSYDPGTGSFVASEGFGTVNRPDRNQAGLWNRSETIVTTAVFGIAGGWALREITGGDEGDTPETTTGFPNFEDEAADYCGAWFYGGTLDTDANSGAFAFTDGGDIGRGTFGAPDAADFFTSFTGQNKAERLIHGLLGLVSTWTMMWMLGGLALGVLIAQMGLAVMLLLLPVTLALMMLPAQRRSDALGTKMAKITLSMFASKLWLTFVLILLLVFTQIGYALAGNLFGGGFGTEISVAFVPIAAIKLMRTIFTNMGVGDVTKFRVAAGTVVAGASAAANTGRPGGMSEGFKRDQTGLGSKVAGKKWGKPKGPSKLLKAGKSAASMALGVDGDKPIGAQLKEKGAEERKNILDKAMEGWYGADQGTRLSSALSSAKAEALQFGASGGDAARSMRSVTNQRTAVALAASGPLGLLTLGGAMLGKDGEKLSEARRELGDHVPSAADASLFGDAETSRDDLTSADATSFDDLDERERAAAAAEREAYSAVGKKHEQGSPEWAAAIDEQMAGVDAERERIRQEREARTRQRDDQYGSVVSGSMSAVNLDKDGNPVATDPNAVLDLWIPDIIRSTVEKANAQGIDVSADQLMASVMSGVAAVRPGTQSVDDQMAGMGTRFLDLERFAGETQIQFDARALLTAELSGLVGPDGFKDVLSASGLDISNPRVRENVDRYASSVGKPEQVRHEILAKVDTDVKSALDGVVRDITPTLAAQQQMAGYVTQVHDHRHSYQQVNREKLQEVHGQRVQAAGLDMRHVQAEYDQAADEFDDLIREFNQAAKDGRRAVQMALLRSMDEVNETLEGSAREMSKLGAELQFSMEAPSMAPGELVKARESLDRSVNDAVDQRLAMVRQQLSAMHANDEYTVKKASGKLHGVLQEINANVAHQIETDEEALQRSLDRMVEDERRREAHRHKTQRGPTRRSPREEAGEPVRIFKSQDA